MDIHGLAYGGRGVGRVDNFVVFVPYTAPGDRVRARVTKAKSSFAEAELEEVLTPAPGRAEPPCSHFGTCGGCSWQHLPIEEQRRWKEQIVRDALRGVKGLDPETVIADPLVPSPSTFHYRNKMEFTFGREFGQGPLKLGFHTPGNWRSVLNIERCWLMPDVLNPLLDAARAEGERQGLTAWNPSRHEGNLRQLVLRWSDHEQRVLVALLTAEPKGVDFDAFRTALTDACPAVKGFVWGLNSGKSDVARAEEVMGSWGEDLLEERLGDLKFQISLASFFQTNTRGAVELYTVAKKYLALTGRERLLDAYCGTGTIGQFCADQCDHIYGIELIKEAIWDARENARRNGLSNCTFMAGDMAMTLPKLLGSVPGPLDRVVVDPPRAGMAKKALAQLARLHAPVLVYVSCNPTTMARDFEQLIEEGYRIERLCPVDMFPQTYHIECVARCVRDVG
ncbi:MAG: 23S rRNA (uracil(1939)-C(5))-methyltransferase RlmD [Sumerlaeia bacterium]